MYETPDGLGWVFDIEANEMIAADLSKAKTTLPVKPFSSILRNEEWRFVYSLTDGWLKGRDIVTYAYNKTLYHNKKASITIFWRNGNYINSYREGKQPESDNIIYMSDGDWFSLTPKQGQPIGRLVLTTSLRVVCTKVIYKRYNLR